MGCGLLFRIPDFLTLLISILFRKTSEMLEEFHFFSVLFYCYPIFYITFAAVFHD